MRIRKLRSFDQDYRALPDPLKKKVDKQLRLLAVNLRHPSLQVHRIQGAPGIWECYVDLHYRLTFMIEGDLLILRRVGPHDILKKESKN